MLLLTGITGKVGGATAQSLLAAGTPFRALARDPQRVSLSGSFELVQADLDNPASLASAMESVTAALLVAGNSEAQLLQEKQFVDAALQAGVEHIVKISSMEAGPTVTAVLPKLHFQVEEYIKSKNIGWTFLQPNFFMQNLLMYAQPIANAGVFALPFGDAKAAPIDCRDVGAVCAEVLGKPAHVNKTYRLTGSELLSFYDVAEVFSKVLSKSVKYVPQSPEEFREVLGNFIHSTWHLDALCELFAQIADGALATTTDDCAEILQRQPRPVAEFVADFAQAFTA